jgi:hypothetical protein
MDFNIDTNLDNMKSRQTNMKGKAHNFNSEFSSKKTPLYSDLISDFDVG